MHYTSAKSVDVAQFIQDFTHTTMIHVVETADLGDYSLEKVAFL